MRWLHGRQAEHSIILYSKAGCHLCVEAEGVIARLARRYRISLLKVDIQDDPTLYERYKYTIPVVEVDEQAEMEWPFDEASLARTLEMTV